MKQIDLARESGLNYQTINDLYNGNSDGVMFKTLAILCRTLDVQVGDLLEYVPGPEADPD